MSAPLRLLLTVLLLTAAAVRLARVRRAGDPSPMFEPDGEAMLLIAVAAVLALWE